eukprot:GHVU01002503.1.p2 GENE.GHVU01002503.1~~GHVU01002503.1.p2  ORF type:complete len:310 (-),score=19.62 GHVU01002503.1:372-1274(-)
MSSSLKTRISMPPWAPARTPSSLLVPLFAAHRNVLMSLVSDSQMARSPSRSARAIALRLGDLGKTSTRTMSLATAPDTDHRIAMAVARRTITITEIIAAITALETRTHAGRLTTPTDTTLARTAITAATLAAMHAYPIETLAATLTMMRAPPTAIAAILVATPDRRIAISAASLVVSRAPRNATNAATPVAPRAPATAILAAILMAIRAHLTAINAALLATDRGQLTTTTARIPAVTPVTLVLRPISAATLPLDEIPSLITPTPAVQVVHNPPEPAEPEQLNPTAMETPLPQILRSTTIW